MTVRPCITPTCPALTNATRCHACQQAHDRERNTRRTHYQGGYHQAAARLRNEANADPTTRCWLCGLLRIDGDPWTADHVRPGDPDSPLAVAHRSCNSSRGDGTRQAASTRRG